MPHDPLRRNDPVPGVYPASWYAASAPVADPRAPLRGSERADVAIVGAGFTGLWAAKTLAERGLKAVVLEAHRVGWGASGRNGGQVGTGYNWHQKKLEGRLGRDAARAVWDIAEEGKRQLRDFIAAEAPEARYLPGVAHGEYSASDARESRENAEHLARHYGYDQIEALDRDAFRALVKSPLYVGGTLDRGAGHIHPLRYALALARAAEGAGVVIHEGSIVLGIDKGEPATLRTKDGELRAQHVILAGNGYMPDLEPQVAARVMPINSFIGATEPLGNRWTDVLADDIAVADSKFVVNYYRFSEDRASSSAGARATAGLSQGHRGALADAARQPLPAAQGRADRAILGRHAGHHHDAASAHHPGRAQHRLGWRIFGPWRGAFGRHRPHHGRGGAGTGRALRRPRGAAHASLPWRGDRSGAAPDHGDDVVRAAGPLGGLRP
jgi:gamma-glutamylputrescine oxidase